MGAKTQDAVLDSLVGELGVISEDARRVFGRLSAAQLNWKPSAERWSVGQCFDHLITANRCFFPVAEKVAAGEHRESWWERFSPLSGLFGRLVLRALDPAKGMKAKAPGVFLPTSSDVPADIIERFAAHQQELTARMRATAGRDPGRVIITSPVNPLATYSLLDAFRIAVAHERKHFGQARRVTEEAGFPRG